MCPPPPTVPVRLCVRSLNRPKHPEMVNTDEQAIILHSALRVVWRVQHIETSDSSGTLHLYLGVPLCRNKSQLKTLTAKTFIAKSKVSPYMNNAMQTIYALRSALAARDADTARHSQRLVPWAIATAQALHCTRYEMKRIALGTLLHDLGKIGIPDAILHKPGPLTMAEWAVMRQHPDIGADMLTSLRGTNVLAPLLRAHHEHWDGSGYPHGLRGHSIPLGARIIAVVDAYGAMTEDRVYRAAIGHKAALIELQRCAGSYFDPRIVEAFLNVISQDISRSFTNGRLEH